jgi:hypothetical protein
VWNSVSPSRRRSVSPRSPPSRLTSSRSRSWGSLVRVDIAPLDRGAASASTSVSKPSDNRGVFMRPDPREPNTLGDSLHGFCGEQRAVVERLTVPRTPPACESRKPKAQGPKPTGPEPKVESLVMRAIARDRGSTMHCARGLYAARSRLAHPPGINFVSLRAAAELAVAR